MMNTTMAALLKRVERIEAKQHVEAPVRIIANYPVETTPPETP